jgi:hypothetical protein
VRAAGLLLVGTVALVQETPEALEARARTLEQQGELAAAREVWITLSKAREPGPQRDACIDASRALGMRLDVRKEISAARPLDERVFAELGIEQANEAGLVVNGARVAWKDAGFELLARAGAAARLSQAARAGLVFERLARGNAKEQESALADLGHILALREVEAHDASAAVARVRGERLPPHGYVFRNGKWIDADVLASEAHVTALEALARAFESANAAEREARLAAISRSRRAGATRRPRS